MRLALLLVLFSGALSAAPQPKPPIPTAVTFTQGPVTRSLPIRSANCTDFRASPINGQHGLVRFRLVCGNTVQGSYVGNLRETEELLDLVRTKKIAPIPVTTMPLTKADDALSALRSGKLIGRAVLTP